MRKAALSGILVHQLVHMSAYFFTSISNGMMIKQGSIFSGNYLIMKSSNSFFLLINEIHLSFLIMLSVLTLL